MTAKLHIVFVQNRISHYRIPLFKKIASHPCIDTTLTYGTTGDERNSDIDKHLRLVKGDMLRIPLFGKQLLWHKPIISLLRANRYDVVIHNFEVKIASIMRTCSIQKTHGGSFIVWGIGSSLRPTPLLDWIRRFIARKSDAIVFYSEANRQRYIGMGIDPHKMFVARNSIDLSPIQASVSHWPADRLEAFRETNGLNRNRILLTVGKLVKRKRLDLLLQTITTLRQEHPNVKLIVVGDGPEKESLRKITKRLDLEDNVEFIGKVTEQEGLAPWFLVSELIVAPGQVGLLATEAHAYGRPLVACDNPSIQGPEIEILAPGETGVVFKDGDAPALAAAISDLLKNEDKRRRFGDAGLLRAQKEYGIPNMANGFLRAISYVTGRQLPLFDSRF